MPASALLMMDVQQDLVDRFPDPAYLPRLAARSTPPARLASR